MRPASIDPRALADLARLELGEDEARQFAAQLATIVGYLEVLRGVEVDAVAEYLVAECSDSALAADLPTPSLRVDEALAGAARVREGWIEVPKIKSP